MKKKLILKTPLGEYPLEKFSFGEKKDFSVLKKIADTSKSKYFNKPQEFIRRLKSDYK